MPLPKRQQRRGKTTLLGIRDDHKQRGPREKAMRILRTQRVARYFMEFSCTTLGSNRQLLNDCLSELKRNGATEITAHTELTQHNFFAALDKTDASPTVLQLAAAAIGRGVHVYAADADLEAVKEQIKVHPYGNSYEFATNKLLIGSLGIELRDRSTARLIAHVLSEHAEPGSVNLLLWGAGHFDADEYRPGLDTMILEAFEASVKGRHSGYSDHADGYVWEIEYRDETPT